jgi:hypothetical protein
MRSRLRTVQQWLDSTNQSGLGSGSRAPELISLVGGPDPDRLAIALALAAATGSTLTPCPGFRVTFTTDCSASTSQKEPTSPAGASTRSSLSRTPSTAGPGRSSAGRPPPRLSTNSYGRSTKQVLQRLVEPDQYLSVALLPATRRQRHRRVGRLQGRQLRQRDDRKTQRALQVGAHLPQGHGRASRTTSSPPSNTSTGSTTGDATARSSAVATGSPPQQPTKAEFYSQTTTAAPAAAQ